MIRRPFFCRLRLYPILLGWLLLEAPAFAATGAEPPAPLARIFLSLALILAAAKFASHFAERLGQSAVLGELVAGLVLGNLRLLGFTGLDYLKGDFSVDLLARIGVILLLFQIGLESTVAQMVKVGISSFLVAALGVIGTFTLGWGAAALFLPGSSPAVHAFLGATITATSVGISARVLKDMGRSQSPEARVILGAAVIDDVIGLVILSVATGIAGSGGGFSFSAVGATVLKASLFLIGSVAIGAYLSPRLFALASRLQTNGVLLATGLGFCFFLSWLAGVMGLAPIVGAFAAGLILEEVHYHSFLDRGEHRIEELVAPIASFLVPIFFVLMGIRTDLRSFAEPGVLALAAALIAAAVLGKQACRWGVLGKGIDPLPVAIGMIPRGEVQLIFASAGLTLLFGGNSLITPSVFAAVVLTVIGTTLITPPLLKWSLERKSGQPRSPSLEK
jgi:Kef-type K+ transport system membrane component KefB